MGDSTAQRLADAALAAVDPTLRTRIERAVRDGVALARAVEEWAERNGSIEDELYDALGDDDAYAHCLAETGAGLVVTLANGLGVVIAEAADRIGAWAARLPSTAVVRFHVIPAEGGDDQRRPPPTQGEEPMPDAVVDAVAQVWREGVDLLPAVVAWGDRVSEVVSLVEGVAATAPYATAWDPWGAAAERSGFTAVEALGGLVYEAVQEFYTERSSKGSLVLAAGLSEQEAAGLRGEEANNVPAEGVEGRRT